MGLNFNTPRRRAAERPNAFQRLAAAFGLAGLVLAWAVMLIPCALWLLFSLATRRGQARPLVGQALDPSRG